MRIVDWFNRHPMWRRAARAGGKEFTVPTFDRWLYVKLHALKWMGEDVPWLAEQIGPGMTVVDAGANIGYYTLLFAGLVGPRGKVISFEPDPDLFHAAEENVRRNGQAEMVEMHHCALGAQPAELHLMRGQINSGDNRLRRSAAASPRAVAVKVRPLDDVIGARRVDWVKIDVQGWECDVLEGMRQTLERNREGMRIYFEFWPRGIQQAGREPMEAIATLRGAGYAIYRKEQKLPVSDGELAEFCRTARRLTAMNLLASGQALVV